ncbi:hypothetical protein J7F02_10745 [Streptomyces sp. ISL-112]|uniref:hypothetical protein n=1 Tax=unclassified Streptomyces TaxID=2593676 RepID=UPI001BE73665|nr:MULTISPECIES: hypothetical protein [unclassified Streptomyces]MBT2426142.1 hypothetical protein [Streptomyces sp. ISL-112]MBT2461319.1 hypothetical protein [Streptomyces sp. ISL-63]
MAWERVETTSRCESCRAYWNTLQDLGEAWDAAGRPHDPEGWGQQIGLGLAMYSEHLATHLPAAPKEAP